jgi:hypothetical protein
VALSRVASSGSFSERRSRGERLFEFLVLLFQRFDAACEALHFRQHGGQVVGHGGHGEAGRQQGGDQIAAHDQ